MLSKLLNKHYIVLKKGHNIHIIIGLLTNKILLLRLAIYKWLHGIHKPIVHYYAVCWNEEMMLPFMFQHYDRFVDRYTIYDNYSDDRSEEIIRSHKNASIIKFKTDGFDDTAHNNIKNNCWKRSRGKADWVIVCDMDEFLYHDDMANALQDLAFKGYTVVKPVGYNMYSDSVPTPGMPLTQQVRQGLRDKWFDKCICFDPHAVVEINYRPGAHECYPVGRIKRNTDEFKLLHYKNISLEFILSRKRLYAARLSETNQAHGYGTQYCEEENKVIEEFNSALQQVQEVI